MRPTSQEETAIGKLVCYSVPERRSRPHPTEPHREVPGWSEGRGSDGEI